MSNFTHDLLFFDRLLGIEMLADWREPQTPGLYIKHAQACEQTAAALSPGDPEKVKLRALAATQQRLSAAAWVRSADMVRT